jgi:peroxiredoxin
VGIAMYIKMLNCPSSRIFVLLFFLCLISCNEDFKKDDYRAYFGGEVINTTSRFIYFSKDGVVIDTIPLQKDNTFFVQFDSLAPGMYTFKHDPEYQYVYFDKNDSIMVRLNSNNFDESVIFCGRGDAKNNYLMESYLKNEAEKEKMFDVFDYDFAKFNANIDSTFNKNEKSYLTHKKDINWSKKFDLFAKATLDFNYFSKKELYPIIHKLRTSEDLFEKLPKKYYSYRKNIDFNNVELSTYTPFVIYLSHLLNNVGAVKYHNHFSEVDLALTTNINKLNIADTLIRNEKVKNKILNNIAFSYLLEDQNMVNNQKFLKIYRKYSTDNSRKNEILKIENAIKLLKIGNQLPEVNLIGKEGVAISSNSILNKKTVLFFWSKEALTHLAAAHKKVLSFKLHHPEYQYIAVNLDGDQKSWVDLLANYKFEGIKEYRCENFEIIKNKWAITKIHRALILDSQGKIKDAFTNLFDVKFEDKLK